eukprot:jgi/Mesen1/5380/ME000268S04577
MADKVVVTFRKQKAILDASSADNSIDVISTLLSMFHLRRDARIILKRRIDGVVIVPGPRITSGEYDLEVVDDGRGDTRQHAILALIGAPFLLLYYSFVLPKVFRDNV